MEYCDKASYLSDKILEVSILGDSQSIYQCHTPIGNNDKMVSYVQDILEGLKYVHQSGVIHDDIKLENLLMQSAEREDEYNSVKICDFGLSQIIDPKVGMAQLEAKCGTMGYMAPEVKEVTLITFNHKIEFLDWTRS